MGCSDGWGKTQEEIEAERRAGETRRAQRRQAMREFCRAVERAVAYEKGSFVSMDEKDSRWEMADEAFSRLLTQHDVRRGPA